MRNLRRKCANKLDIFFVARTLAPTKLLSGQADAEAKGATILRCGPECGGRQQPLHIVTGVTEDMRIAREGIFGL